MSRDRSSFWGEIQEIPNIGVDNFTLYYKRAYFLSHFHADHIVGLNTMGFLDNLKRTKAKIYMSEITTVIVDSEYCDNKNRKAGLTQYITPLKIGSTTITLPGEDGSNDEFLQVKLIPAGHSLGSVMFLFKYKDKTILYTGDFRIKPDNLPHYGQLHENGEPIKIDSMYLDTTFQDIDHIRFPSRKESVEKIIELIKDWLKSAGNRVAMFARTKYAYEFVFNEIYRQLGIKVHVDNFKWNIYRKIPDQVKGVTNNTNEVLIHLCPRSTDNHYMCLPMARQANYLNIYMSAYKWSRDDEDVPYIEETSENNYSVCFSTHCSRSELIYFVNYFTPKTVIGFRQPYNGNIVVDYEDEEEEEESIVISQPTPKKLKLDAKVNRTVDKELLRKTFDW